MVALGLRARSDGGLPPLGDATAFPLHGAHGALLVASSGEAVLVVRRLPPAPAGKAYEVWVVAQAATRRAPGFCAARWSSSPAPCRRAAGSRSRSSRQAAPKHLRDRSSSGQRQRRLMGVVSDFREATETRAGSKLAHLSDEALLALASRSDEAALGELYDRYGRVAYGLALRILRDRALAEDAVQEAFLAVWRSAGSFLAEQGKPSTWILTLVHRRAVDLVRREERRRAEPLDELAQPDRRGDRRGGVAARAAAGRPGGAAQAPGRPARGARARLLRRLHAVGAGRAARPAARDDQEPDVHRPQAAARAARRVRARRRRALNRRA